MLPLLLLKLLPTLIGVGGSWFTRHQQKKLLKEIRMGDPKAGFGTTEFWMVIAGLITNVLAQHGITLEVGMVSAALAGIYTVCRTVLKVVHAKNNK